MEKERWIFWLTRNGNYSKHSKRNKVKQEYNEADRVENKITQKYWRNHIFTLNIQQIY